MAVKDRLSRYLPLLLFLTLVLKLYKICDRRRSFIGLLLFILDFR